MSLVYSRVKTRGCKDEVGKCKWNSHLLYACAWSRKDPVLLINDIGIRALGCLMMLLFLGVWLGKTGASPGTNTAFHLVCLSGYIKHLAHLLLGNTEAFTDSLYVCVVGLCCLEFFFKEGNQQIQSSWNPEPVEGGFDGSLWTSGLRRSSLLIILQDKTMTGFGI